MCSDDRIPLSVLSLDVQPPVGGWERELQRRGISVEIDDLDRPSISRRHARAIVSERAESARRRREAADRQAAEYAAQAAAQVPHGWPAYEGVASAAEGMLAQARQELPRRKSVLETALSNDETLEYVPIRERDES